jgi:hypothetical protein
MMTASELVPYAKARARIIAPRGSVVHAQPPAAIAGCWEVAQRICDFLVLALAEALPQKVCAAGKGIICNISFGGINPQTQRARVTMLNVSLSLASYAFKFVESEFHKIAAAVLTVLTLISMGGPDPESSGMRGDARTKTVWAYPDPMLHFVVNVNNKTYECLLRNPNLVTALNAAG